jgi:hypothetical protein
MGETIELNAEEVLALLRPRPASEAEIREAATAAAYLEWERESFRKQEAA